MTYARTTRLCGVALAVLTMPALAQSTPEQLIRRAQENQGAGMQTEAEEILRRSVVARFEAQIAETDTLLTRLGETRDRLRERVAGLMTSDEGKRIGTLPSSAMFFLQQEERSFADDSELTAGRTFVGEMKEYIAEQRRTPKRGYTPSLVSQTEANRIYFWTLGRLAELNQQQAWLDNASEQTRRLEGVDTLPSLQTRIMRVRSATMQLWNEAADEGRKQAAAEAEPLIRENARVIELERALVAAEQLKNFATLATERSRLQTESILARQTIELEDIRLELERQIKTDRQRQLDFETQTRLLEETLEQNRGLKDRLDRDNLSRARHEADARSDAVQRLLAPVLAHGTWQPGMGTSNPAGETMPMSFKALEAAKALEAGDQGLKNLMAILNARGCNGATGIKTMEGQGNRKGHLDTMRPKLGFPERFRDLSYEQGQELAEIQRLLRRLGPTLVELEMLAP
jgi:hypothetical protein